MAIIINSKSPLDYCYFVYKGNCLLHHPLDSTPGTPMGSTTGSVPSFAHPHCSLEQAGSCTANNFPSQHPGQRPHPKLSQLPTPLAVTHPHQGPSSILPLKEDWKKQMSKSSNFLRNNLGFCVYFSHERNKCLFLSHQLCSQLNVILNLPTICTIIFHVISVGRKFNLEFLMSANIF